MQQCADAVCNIFTDCLKKEVVGVLMDKIDDIQEDIKEVVGIEEPKPTKKKRE